MLIYNVTTKVEWPVAEEWLQWMQEKHIPEILATGCFEKHQLLRLLEIDEEEGPTYAAQYYATSKDDFDMYIAKHSNAFRAESFSKWGNKFIAYRSLMLVV
ncbi:MAG: hypothetical protein JWQ96_2945 [Segetibacter sp.]|nr:hypothetical protein [Segetibacter sp.]